MIRASRGNQHRAKVIVAQDKRQRENNTKRLAAFQGFALCGRVEGAGKQASSKAPSQPSPRGRSTTQPPQTQQNGTPAPWGGHGEGLPQAAATLTELRFPSPGLRAKHATLGIRPHQPGNSTGVAISRRRYTQSYGFHQPILAHYPAEYNAFG